ncbi:galactokinase [Lachnospiraceae bacterium NE2001]|nr:galactokinase [Lachnospiraceae bacterium NE2001]
MKTDELIVYIEDGKMDERLTDIYLDKEKLSYQRSRYIDAVKKYKELFGSSDEYSDDVCIISAPGRTEVCGNHTDHQHGQVLAASINDDAIAIVGITDSPLDMVNIKSEGYDMISFSLNDIEKQDNEEGTTLALIKGVIAGCKNRGYAIGGFSAYVTSDVLGGSGLSSSAAFETLVGNIISHLYNNGSIDAVTIAIIGQYAENYYFGKPCGLMDQMACSVGSLCYINFGANASDDENSNTVTSDINKSGIQDSRPLIRRIELDLDSVGYSLCITDTKGSHADLTPDYAAVPAEMKSVAGFFGEEYLNDVPENKVLNSIPELREKLGDRAVLRALHFYEENNRVLSIADVLMSGESHFTEFLKLVKASGDSSFKFLQNVYTSHDIQHQNVSIALCLSEKVLASNTDHSYGVCRVHGGGFAGTIQAFVKNERVADYKEALDQVFGEGSCAVLKIRKYGGLRVI